MKYYSRKHWLGPSWTGFTSLLCWYNQKRANYRWTGYRRLWQL